MSDTALKTAYGFHRAGDLAKAAELYREVLRAEPSNINALYLFGLIHFQRGEFSQAEIQMGEALKHNPGFLDAWRSRAAALTRLERAEEALDCYDRALALKPDSGEVWNNRGNVLLSIRRPREALASFDRAAALLPGNAHVWNNRGNALAELKRFDDALQDYNRSLALAPDEAGILNHRAIALLEAKRYGEASRDFASVLGLVPDFDYARGNLVYSLLHICDWRELTVQKTEIDEGLREGRRVITPIQYAALSGSPELQFQSASVWVGDKYPPAKEPLWRGDKYRHERIRLAYLSADFHSHATAALMAGVFERHDTSHFEVHAISFGPDDGSPMRRRLLNAFEHFYDVHEANDREIAEMLRRLDIGIAVDIKGYTEGARPGILAHRPAPVQAQYLGFPGTMGAGYIDYVIADAIVIPDDHRRFYSEKRVALPGSYQCNDDKRAIAARTPTRTELGLPETGFVFCCFNNSYKIAPGIFAVWTRLLTAVEGSVLWLLEDDREAAENLRREVQARNVSPSRLVFGRRMNLDEHLARHRLADLFLDTLPYGAHTTASDALWAGLPVLTCLGASFAGRVAASLNAAIGLPELIVQSQEEYESLALKLAREPEFLRALKTNLEKNRDSTSLFDTARFTCNLESAYAAMWQRAQNGEPPADLTIGEAS